MKKSVAALVIAILAASSTVDAKEAMQSGAVVFAGLDKFAAGMSDKSKRDFSPDVAMTMGYVLGVADSDGAVCLDPRVSMAQILLTVRDYMRGHQELMDKSAVNAVSGALRQAFPCQAGRPGATGR
ncbi:MAG: hypothetical protein HY020_08745 [Burkholderiales bacterium]|nr:hypothetical protein [Burkholderiales bacterium]